MVGKATGEPETSQNYTVTLALSPEQTSVLLYARQQGGVQLSLRSPTDEGLQNPVVPINYVTALQSILGPQAIAEPPEMPEPRMIEVFKGLERSVVSFDE